VPTYLGIFVFWMGLAITAWCGAAGTFAFFIFTNTKRPPEIAGYLMAAMLACIVAMFVSWAIRAVVDRIKNGEWPTII
jgi:hypothetical protein